jgi:putative ABC transport system substrate-binding protein
MRRRKFIVMLGTAAFARSFAVSAQSAVEHPLVGILFPGKIPNPRIDALLQGLEDNGYFDGRNVAITIRAADFDNARLAELANDLVRSKVDVLLTSTTAGVIAAHAATRTVPIVFAAIADPVALGVAESLAHPGGNVTGITLLSPEINGKRLALIKEAFPRATKIAVLQNSTNSGSAIMSSDIADVAHSLGLQARVFSATRPEQFDDVMDAVAAWSADAVMALDDPVFNFNPIPLTAAAARHTLPLICDAPEMATAGCLFTYGVDIIANYRHAASLVAKILKGAQPADLPIENPTRFEAVVNLKAAKALGLTLPTSILLRADKVIE